MMISPRIRTCAVSLALLGVMAGIFSCREGRIEESEVEGREVAVPTKLRYNRVSDLPAAVYQSQGDSPIHWQPWTAETFAMARKTNRLLFVVIAVPQQAGFLTVLEHLAASPEVVARLNDEYVPVLVDADAAGEVGLLAPALCAESERSLHYPIFLWMTYEGNPAGWIPVHARKRQGVLDVFNQSHGMIGRMWREDSEYVRSNSALDQKIRKERMHEHIRLRKYSEEPEMDVARSLRKMTSLYDGYSRSFDEAGGLFPFGALELLSVAARHPGIPLETREKCAFVQGELLRDLLPSAMFDPLDGGVFAARRGPSWALPSFQRDCMSQARVVSALVEAWHASGDEFALERAQSVLGFIESRYRTGDGLYSIGLEMPGTAEDWMWTKEEIIELLPAVQADWWIRESNIQGLGNLPYEAAPRGGFFRANTLALRHSPAKYAAGSGAGGKDFLTNFESSRKILLERRAARLPRSSPDRIPHAGATFRMVSAYAAMFTASGDGEHRKKAVDLLEAAREGFMVGGVLRSMKGEADDEVALGRAFHYALALQASLDVAAITGDDVWVRWAETLSSLAAQQFAGDGILDPCADRVRLLDMPLSDTSMLFDDTATGLFSLCALRMAALGVPMDEAFHELVALLPAQAVERPVLHTDVLLATLLRHFPVTVTQVGNVPESLRAEIRRLSLRSVMHGDQVEQGGEEEGVRVVGPDGVKRVARTTEELRAVLENIRR